MLIRKMEVEDLDCIVEIEKSIFSSSWNKDSFLYELNKNVFALYFVLEDNHNIVGYLGMWALGDQSQITTIGISKNYQGNGYSNLLMEYAIKVTEQLKYPNINLEVRVSNYRAISLYEKYGFKNVALRKNYYQDNHEDAYLMVKEMEG